MAEMYNEKNVEMQILTQDYVQELTKIWSRIFDPQMCFENLTKLVEHAKVFYEDLLKESLEKQSYINKEIEDLQEEAENLRRLLKTEVQLPCLTHTNVPLLVLQSEMDKSLTELRECLRLRRNQICELLLEQEALCDELGEPPRPLLADPLPTAEEIEDFRSHLEQLKEERDQRMSKLSKLRREIKNQMQILELQVNTDAEDRLLNHRQIKLNKETFAYLQRMHDRYGDQVREVQERIDGMRNKLETLWERLETSPGTRKKFKRYTDYTQHTYDVFYGEMQRCEKLKSQNIKHFVQQIRQEIVQWWDKTLKSDEQRSHFSNFNSKYYTDDLLELHEMELDDLKLYYETNRQIFELYADREILWDRMTAFEAKATEPGRYNNRGGQLLKEEKERKTIATKLPKIEQQIAELVHDYEEREHVPFLVHGKNILEVMASEWEKKRGDKEQKNSARKQVPTPLSRSRINLARTPMSQRKATSTISLRKAASNANLTSASAAASSSQKRKLQSSDKTTPLAKRSLMHALNSPAVFLKPSYTASQAGAATSSSTSKKSPQKKTRVIGTTIRRHSGRRSHGGLKKRRSMNKNTKPKIRINDGSGGQTDEGSTDDAYESFQNSIEPTSRSSIVQNGLNRRRHQEIVNDENSRLARLPKPTMIRTPSKLNLREYRHQASSHHTSSHSPASASSSAGSSRKWTTKNLPIII